MNPFLNAEELIELTDKQRPKAQCRALDAKGIPYVASLTKGIPKVARKYLYHEDKNVGEQSAPDFGSM